MCLNGQLHKIDIYVALFVRKEIKAREISGIEDVLLYYCCKLISGRCVNTEINCCFTLLLCSASNCYLNHQVASSESHKKNDLEIRTKHCCFGEFAISFNIN